MVHDHLGAITWLDRTMKFHLYAQIYNIFPCYFRQRRNVLPFFPPLKSTDLFTADFAFTSGKRTPFSLDLCMSSIIKLYLSPHAVFCFLPCNNNWRSGINESWFRLWELQGVYKGLISGFQSLINVGIDLSLIK